LDYLHCLPNATRIETPIAYVGHSAGTLDCRGRVLVYDSHRLARLRATSRHSQPRGAYLFVVPRRWWRGTWLAAH
jgi:hypothetical protein